MGKSKWVGKRVKILNPEFVVRVGYPKQVQDYEQEVVSQYDTKLCQAFGPLWEGHLRKRILREVTYTTAKRDGFGGAQRSIHTITNPSLQGKVFEIWSTARCWTGVYYRSWGSGEDYEPAGLGNAEAHVLLEVSCMNLWAGITPEGQSHPRVQSRFSGTWIESKNVTFDLSESES